MVIVLRHVPYEGPGLIEDMLDGRGLSYKIIDIFDEGVPLGVAGFTGIVSMGGPMSVNDGMEAIDREKALLLEAIERGIPILGVCLGAQIIAGALGSRVYPGDQPEVGWGEVILTPTGTSDPILAGVAPVFPVLHWHGETFDLPEGAVNLAFSEKYENQAFRVGERTYGLQFHLEVDGGMVKEWVEQDQHDGAGIVVDPDEIMARTGSRLQEVRFVGALVIGRFLDLVAGRMSG